MAAIYADTIGDFGHQLNARRAAQAAAMQQAQAETARFAMARRQAEQEQLNQRANIFAQAARAQQEQQRAQANAIQQFAFNKQLADANQAAQAKRLQTTLDAQAKQNDARLEAQKYVAEQKDLLSAQKERSKSAYKLAAGGSLDFMPSATPEQLKAEFLKQSDDETEAGNLTAMFLRNSTGLYNRLMKEYQDERARLTKQVFETDPSDPSMEEAQRKADQLLSERGRTPPARPTWLPYEAPTEDAIRALVRSRVAGSRAPISAAAANAFLSAGGGFPNSL